MTYLSASRGVRCSPERVLVATTAQSALEISMRMLTDPGEYAWMESPGYAGGRSAFETSGLAVEEIPVDASGVQNRLRHAFAPVHARPVLGRAPYGGRSQMTDLPGLGPRTKGL